MANLDPMHNRGPSPNGRKACGGRPSDRVGVNHSGSKVPGALCFPEAEESFLPDGLPPGSAYDDAMILPGAEV